MSRSKALIQISLEQRLFPEPFKPANAAVVGRVVSFKKVFKSV